MTRDEAAKLHQLIDTMVDDGPTAETISEITLEEPKRELPKDKRVIRTKSTGDRVYFVDEVEKTKAWVTSPQILEKLGFTMADVQDIDDKDLLGYRMVASIYKVD